MTNDDALHLIHATAVDDYDRYGSQLPFDEANERRGEIDERLQEAVDYLGEDEAAEAYDLAWHEVSDSEETY